MVLVLYPKPDTIHSGFRCQYLQYFWGFMAIGSLTTLVDICILYLLTEWGGLWYLLSALISYCSGALMSYILNKTLNFKNHSSDYRNQGMMFLCIASCSLLLNLGIMYGGVTLLGTPYMIAKVIATGLGFFLNYFGQTLITFRFWR